MSSDPTDGKQHLWQVKKDGTILLESNDPEVIRTYLMKEDDREEQRLWCDGSDYMRISAKKDGKYIINKEEE